jgi:hypothetical protein
MEALSSSGSNVNAGLSSVCAIQQSSCRNTCQQLVSKYQALLNACDGCESESVYSSTLSRLSSTEMSCRNLQSRADLLAGNGAGMANPTAYSQYCQSVASGVPQNNGMGSRLNGLAAPGSSGLKPDERRGQGEFGTAVEGPRGGADFNVPSGPSKRTAFEGIRYGEAAAAWRLQAEDTVTPPAQLPIVVLPARAVSTGRRRGPTRMTGATLDWISRNFSRAEFGIRTVAWRGTLRSIRKKRTFGAGYPLK